jgi:hypothetical protein
MCDPRTLDVIGVLDNVEPEGSSLSWGYDTDTRFSGTIQTLGSNWIEHSALRVIHRVPEWNYSNVLATGLVMERPWSRTQGGNVVQFQLSSSLSALERDYLPWHHCISEGANSNDAFRELVNGAEGRKCRVEMTARNYIYKEARVYEMGDSRLEDIKDICSVSGNHYDVDPYGIITIAEEVPPSQRGIKWTLNVGASRTNVLDGLSGSTTKYNSPTRVVSTYKGTLLDDEGKPVKGDDEKSQSIELWSLADIPGPENSGVRGYTVAVVESIGDLAPQTQEALDARTQSKAQSLSQTYREWECSCLYMPIKAGDMADLVIPDGVDAGHHKCLVKNVQLELGSMVMGLTLKEA